MMLNQNANWMEADAKARRSGKASVFTDLFQIPAYAAEMVQVLRPDLEATEQDIEVVSLSSILMVRPYNDLGLLVKDSLILCSEAQSTWSLNVLVRMFLYLAETYHRYIQNHTDLNIYGTKKIIVPRPYCCLVYTGKKENLPEFLSLAEEFFGKDSSLDLRIRVLSAAGTGDIIQQYVRFCHIFDAQVEQYGRTRKAVEETLLMCKDESVLQRYLEEREKEVQDIMMTLFSQEYATERYGYECKEEGRKEGRKEGLKDGLEKGRKESILKSVRSLMTNKGWDMYEAMDALDISQEDRALLSSKV